MQVFVFPVLGNGSVLFTREAANRYSLPNLSESFPVSLVDIAYAALDKHGIKGEVRMEQDVLNNGTGYCVAARVDSYDTNRSAVLTPDQILRYSGKEIPAWTISAMRQMRLL